MGKQTVHAVIYRDAESDQWVATCLEYGVTTQGDSEQHARAMIKEAVEIYLEDASPAELELLYQPIDGEPAVHLVSIDAAAILHPGG